MEVEPCELPENALLRRCRERGAYTDCYAVDIPQAVSHAAFVEAFYTTWVFKLERMILRLLVSRPSTDAEVRQLALGEREDFAAWSVEARAPDQLLLADFVGRTKSWLMVARDEGSGFGGTRLYFGSAVVPVRDRKTGRSSLGAVHSALLGFHKLYSRVLLSAARARLLRSPTDWRLGAAFLCYLAASLLHFTHNAEYLADYPNLPAWLTRLDVYLAWCGVTALGLLGYFIYRRDRRLGGLALLGIYAGFGFDGLLHYLRAPLAAHTAAMNFTIWFEVAAAASLLAVVLFLAVGLLRRRQLE